MAKPRIIKIDAHINDVSEDGYLCFGGSSERIDALEEGETVVLSLRRRKGRRALKRAIYTGHSLTRYAGVLHGGHMFAVSKNARDQFRPSPQKMVSLPAMGMGCAFCGGDPNGPACCPDELVMRGEYY